MAPPLSAQPRPAFTAIPAPPEPAAIPLNTGGMPGMPEESWFVDGMERGVRNVSRATLTPFLPSPQKNTGAAVIVAPGGAFLALAMDNEGWPVAQWLADNGIAAFVLKYRLLATPTDLAGFKTTIVDKFAAADAGKLDLSVPAPAVADAAAALRLVRARAAEWHVDPRRTGIIGFSAGAMTALSLTLSAKPGDMPAFTAILYGPMLPVTVPAAAPPLFIALASNDPLFGHQGFGLAESWQQARKPVELHFFQAGDHGFGMGRPGTTTTAWPNLFKLWLQTNGFLGKTQ